MMDEESTKQTSKMLNQGEKKKEEKKTGGKKRFRMGRRPAEK